MASAQEILRFLQSQLEAQKAAVTLQGLVAAIKAVHISTEYGGLCAHFPVSSRGPATFCVYRRSGSSPLGLGHRPRSPFEPLGGADLK